jgi:adenylate kinase
MVEYSDFQIDRSEFTSRTFPEGRTLDTATDAGHAWDAVSNSPESSAIFAQFHPCQRIPIVEERHRYRSIILFGMPGSGKGTQGHVLGQLPDWIHISMGDIFRKIPRNGKFGREIEEFTSQGLMVPDDLTVRIFERHLNILEMQELIIPEQHILILDGLPRNYAQAERLSGFIDVMQIFHLKINDTAKAIERLRARALRENRLDDMSEDVIRRRLQTYYDETFQTLSYYPTELIFDVDGGGRMIDVLCAMANRLAQIKKP